jgi:hypothetical protein
MGTFCRCVRSRTVFVQPCVLIQLMCIYCFGRIVEELLRVYKGFTKGV